MINSISCHVRGERLILLRTSYGDKSGLTFCFHVQTSDSGNGLGDGQPRVRTMEEESHRVT